MPALLFFLLLVFLLTVCISLLVLDRLKKNNSHSHKANVAEAPEEPNAAYKDLGYDG